MKKYAELYILKILPSEQQSIILEPIQHGTRNGFVNAEPADHSMHHSCKLMLNMIGRLDPFVVMME